MNDDCNSNWNPPAFQKLVIGVFVLKFHTFVNVAGTTGVIKLEKVSDALVTCVPLHPVAFVATAGEPLSTATLPPKLMAPAIGPA